MQIIPNVHPELTAWHAQLNKKRELMTHPEGRRRELTEAAQSMLARGVVTQDEWLELADLISGAYSFAVEQRAAELFHPASAYVMLDPALRRVGKGSQGMLAFDAAKESPLQIKHGDAGTLQAFTGPGFTWLAGSIHGLELRMENERRFTLVEVGRYLKGGQYVEAITDPESFRLVLHAIADAREDGDELRASHLRQRAHVSPFRACPVCRDRFDSREDCERCAGLGFIRKSG